MLDVILPYASMAMLALLGVFVLFGALFGMGRGVKRAGLRLGIFVGLLLVALLLTPVVASGLLGINISINGQTPTEWVDSLSDDLVVMLQESLGQYMTPFGPYIKEYAVGLVLAVLNIILFFLLYIVIKIISWIIYAIVARFAAPKRDKDGNKNKKHVWWGALVGMVQGVLLFVLFLLPIHGVIGVVNQAAQYQDKASQDTQPQALTTSAYEDDDDNNSQINLSEVFTKVNDSMAVYNNVMRYSGLRFLSNKAFAYQLTVRVKGSDSINLVHDINTAWELYVDAENLGTVIQKVGDIAETYDFSLLTAKDYQILRNYINKAFDIQLLHIADHILGDLDDIFNEPFNEDNDAKLAGTEIYEDSIYGMIISQMATEREVKDVNVNQAYADGLQSVVKYVAKQKLDLVRHDLTALIDFAEAVTSYKFTFDGKAQTLSEVMNGETLDWRGYLDLVTARLSEKQGGYAKDTAMVSVLGDRLKGFSFVQMLGLAHVDNLVVYNKMLDGFFEDEENTAMGDLIVGMVKLFLGDKAFTKGNEKGNWEKLGGVLLDVADVVRDNKDLIDDIMKLFNQESDDDEADVETQDEAGQFDMQAIFEAISKLIISEEYYNEHKDEFPDYKAYGDDVKYKKVYQLVDVIYDTLDTFEPVKNFLIDRLNSMADEADKDAGEETDGKNMYRTLAEMLEGEREDWYSTFRSLVSAANLMNNGTIQGIFEKLQGGDGEGSDLTEKDLAELLDTVVNELNGEDVANLLETVLDMGGIGDTVKGILGETLNGIVDEYLDDKTLGEIFGEETIMVGEEEKKIAAVVKDNLEKLADYFGENENKLTSEKMKAAVEELWTAVQNSKAIKDMLKGLPNGSEGQVETQQLAA